MLYLPHLNRGGISMAETAAQRFDRDWANILDDRRVRGLDNQSLERLKRIYVDNPQADFNSNTTPADDNHV